MSGMNLDGARRSGAVVRVAICDDDPGFRAFLSSIIARHDDLHLVREGSHGAHAIEICRDEQPDVLLIDLDMPVVDGYDAIEHITEHHAGVGIITISGASDNAIAHDRARASGARLVLRKTTAPDQIIDAIRSIAA